MTAGYEQITWICTRSQESSKFCAVASNKSTNGDVPYVRQIRAFRVSGRQAMEAVCGDVIIDCFGRRMTVVKADHRPELPWSMLTGVYLRAVAVGNSARGVVCVIQRPTEQAGLDARREDVIEHHDIECVFARSTITEVGTENVRNKLAQDVCYLDRSVAAKLRSGWSIHDGATRWRVDRVGDLEALDKLPYAIVTGTGLS